MRFQIKTGESVREKTALSEQQFNGTIFFNYYHQFMHSCENGRSQNQCSNFDKQREQKN